MIYLFLTHTNVQNAGVASVGGIGQLALNSLGLAGTIAQTGVQLSGGIGVRFSKQIGKSEAILIRSLRPLHSICLAQLLALVFLVWEFLGAFLWGL